MRLARIFGVVALFGVFGCNGDENGDISLPDIETLFPADNALHDLVEDPDADFNTGPGVQVANTELDVEAIINGAAVPFFEHEFTAFAIECYENGTYELELSVWQMTSPTEATAVFDGTGDGSLPGSSRYTGSTWNDISIGDAGRVANTGTSWWINFRKGPYHVEVQLDPIDPPGETITTDVANAVADQIP